MAVTKRITYVDPDATGTGTGTSWENAYTSLLAWEAAEQADLVSLNETHLCLCRSSNGTADIITTGTNFEISGWTTDADHRITIQVVPSDAASPAGWDTTKYRLEVNQQYRAFRIRESHVTVKGLQLINNYDGVAASGFYCLIDTLEDIIIEDCRVETPNTVASGYGVYMASGVFTDIHIKNCIFNSQYGNGTSGIQIAGTGSQAYVTNCIITGYSDGFRYFTSGPVVNCAVFNSSNQDFRSVYFEGDPSYCASDDGDGDFPISPLGGDWANEFEDYTTGNFRLIAGSTFDYSGIGPEYDPEVPVTTMARTPREGIRTSIGPSVIAEDTVVTVDTDGVSGDYSSWREAITSLHYPLDNNVKIVCSASTGVIDSVDYLEFFQDLNGFNILTVAAEGHEAIITGWDNSRYTLRANAGQYAIIESYSGLQFEGLQLSHEEDASYRNVFAFSSGTGYSFKRCRFSTGSVMVTGTPVVEYEDCIFDGEDVGTTYFGTTGASVFTNCVFNLPGTITSSTACIFTNCSFIAGTIPTGTIDHCASLTGAGTNPVTVSAWATEIPAYATGDFTIIGNGLLHNAGLLSSAPEKDIRGRERIDSTCSIGPMELGSIRYVDTDGVSGDYSGIEDAYAGVPQPLDKSYQLKLQASTGIADSLTADMDISLDTETTFRLTFEQIDSRYVLECDAANNITLTGAFGLVHNITLKGISFYKPTGNANYQTFLEIAEPRDGDIIIEKCKFQYHNNASYRSRLFQLTTRATSTATVVFQNNVVWDVASVASVASSVFYSSILSTQPIDILNNTIIGGYNTLYATVDVTNWTFKNNILNQTNEFGAVVNASSDYNSTTMAAATGGTNDRVSQTFTFLDASNGDYRLAITDTGALGHGVGVDTDPDIPFTDKDNKARYGVSCDIGAFQYQYALGSASATATPISADEKDFPYIVDMSNLPIRFWETCTSDDPRKLRIFSKSGERQHAFDPIEFDREARTGVLRLAEIGVESASAIQVLIRPTRETNIAYEKTDIFGQHAVYSSNIFGYWANPYTLEDRTGTLVDLTSSDPADIMEVSDGPLGSAVRTNVTSAASYLSSPQSIITEEHDVTFISFQRTSTREGYKRGIRIVQSDDNIANRLETWTRNNNAVFRIRQFSSIQAISVDSPIVVNQWHMVAGRHQESSRDIWVDGDLKVTNTDAAPTLSGMTEIRIASMDYAGYTADFAHIMALGTHVSDSYIPYESSQVLSNDTFWGDWTWVEDDDLDIVSALPTLPDSSLTDFSWVIDLSNIKKEFWWAKFDTEDFTKMRLYSYGGTTEYAFDPIDISLPERKGIMRVLRSGSMSISGNEGLRVKPARAHRSAYGVSDTYGQYNAYNSNIWSYWPSGGGADRTSNQNNMSSNGSPVIGGTKGVLGKATNYNGVDQASYVMSVPSAYPLFLSYLMKPASISVNNVTFSLCGDTELMRLYQLSATVQARVSGISDEILSALRQNTWNSFAGRFSSSEVEVYYDGLSSGSPTVNTASFPASDRVAIGALNFNGSWIYTSETAVQHAMIRTDEPSDDEVIYEKTQIYDNAAFWGDWTLGRETVPVPTEGATPTDLVAVWNLASPSLSVESSADLSSFISAWELDNPSLGINISLAPSLLEMEWENENPAVSVSITTALASLIANWSLENPSIGVLSSTDLNDSISSWDPENPSLGVISSVAFQNLISNWNLEKPLLGVRSSADLQELISNWELENPALSVSVNASLLNLLMNWEGSSPSVEVTSSAGIEGLVTTWTLERPSVFLGLGALPTPIITNWNIENPTVSVNSSASPSGLSAPWTLENPTISIEVTTEGSFLEVTWELERPFASTLNIPLPEDAEANWELDQVSITCRVTATPSSMETTWILENPAANFVEVLVGAEELIIPFEGREVFMTTEFNREVRIDIPTKVRR